MLDAYELKQKAKRGELVLGSIYIGGNELNIEAAAKAGADFVDFDIEHNSMGYETLERLTWYAYHLGMLSTLRLHRPPYDPSEITRALAAGVMGIKFPHCKTKEDAIAAVQAIKYSPEGIRGAEMGRGYPQLPGETFAEYMRRMNRATIAMIMVEDEEGVDNIDEILSVEGVDIIAPGPLDLSVSFGIPGQTDHPKVVGAIKKVYEACNKRGIPVAYPGMIAIERREECLGITIRNLDKYSDQKLWPFFFLFPRFTLMEAFSEVTHYLRESLPSSFRTR